MDDFLEQIAVRRHKGLFTFFYYLTWLLLIVAGFLALTSLFQILNVTEEGLRFNFIALVYTLVFGGLAWLLFRRADYFRTEYDYTFTNGILDVSMVLNNKRRRYLTSLDMRDVVRCGPAKGPGFQKVLNEPNLKKHNWFLNRDGALYYFYFLRSNVRHLIVLELTSEMVRVIRSKNYLQKGVWTDENGNASYGVSR